MSTEQILTYEDSSTENILRFICKKRSIFPSEFEHCIEPFYKLSRFIMPHQLLATGKNISDLLNEIRYIYNNNDSMPVIDFTRISSLFNDNKYGRIVLKETVERVLNLYDIEKESETPKKDWFSMINNETNKDNISISRLATKSKEIRSMEGNTKVLTNINLKNYQKSK